MNQPKFVTFIFTAATTGERLDKALSAAPQIMSRSQATSLIDRGFVTRNNQPVKPAHKTTTGETFQVCIPLEEPVEITPFALKLNIIFEDTDVLVVNKPSGLVVHPAAGHRENTLVNALVHHTNNLAGGFHKTRPGIVHRIDKDTSGLLVVAKSDIALRSLAKQFKNKTTHRVYWAVVYGLLRNPSGSITSYIRRHPVDRKKFASEKLQGVTAPTGKLAITHYDVKKANQVGLSLIHCKLETGRTHQIRVHLSELGHPIVADPIYSTTHRIRSFKSVHMRQQVENVPHLMLHAAELGFTHPTTGKRLQFSQPWPDELLPFLQELQFV